MTCQEITIPNTDTETAPQRCGDDPFGLAQIPAFLRRTPGDTRRRALNGMTAAAVASPLGIGASNAAGAEADARLLAIIEEAGAVDFRKPHRPAERIAQYDRLNALYEQIESIPATTLKGVAAKLRYLDQQICSGQVTPLEFVSSALADLDRLAGKV